MIRNCLFSGIAFFAGALLSSINCPERIDRRTNTKPEGRASTDTAPIDGSADMTLKSPWVNNSEFQSSLLKENLADWRTETLKTFCKHRSRPSVEYDVSRYQMKVENLLQKIRSKSVKFESSCTEEFSNLQEQHFLNRMLHAQIPIEGPIGCQECDDLLDLFSRLSPYPDKVFVEIGANKGYDLVSLYARWTNFTTNLVWMRTGLPPGCPYYADVDRHVFPRVIAVEPSPPTFAVLTELLANLPVCNLELHRVAISNAPGRATFRSAQPGAETAHLRWHGGPAPAGGEANSADQDVEVETETVDGFLARLAVPHVDFLAIDTEGLDPLVLDGAGGALAAGRVDLLTFEFSGQWPAGRTLGATVSQLAGLGYDCYYVGHRVLVRLSGAGCWRGAYDRPPQFANILCARRSFELGALLLAPFSLANPSRYDPDMF